MKAKHAATRMMKIIAQGVSLALCLIVSCTTVSNADIPTWPHLCTWESDCSDGSSIRTQAKAEKSAMDYTKEARRYQQEVSTYLDKVRRGRRVATANPADPKFSEEAERERQLKSLGIRPKKKISMNDPLETLTSGLRALELNNGFDVTAHHKKMLTTGPFADAMKRQSVLHPELAQVGFGGGGNNAARQQLKTLEQEDIELGITPPAPVPMIKKSQAPIASADAAEKLRLQRVAEQDAIERKLGIGVKPVETEDEHLKRLGLK